MKHTHFTTTTREHRLIFLAEVAKSQPQVPDANTDALKDPKAAEKKNTVETTTLAADVKRIAAEKQKEAKTSVAKQKETVKALPPSVGGAKAVEVKPIPAGKIDVKAAKPEASPPKALDASRPETKTDATGKSEAKEKDDTFANAPEKKESAESTEKLNEQVKKLTEKTQEVKNYLQEKNPDFLKNAALGQLINSMTFAVKDGRVMATVSSVEAIQKIGNAIGYKLDEKTGTLSRGKDVVTANAGSYTMPVELMGGSAEKLLATLDKVKTMMSGKLEDKDVPEKNGFDAKHKVAATEKMKDITDVPELTKQLEALQNDMPSYIEKGAYGQFVKTLKVGKVDGQVVLESTDPKGFRYMYEKGIISAGSQGVESIKAKPEDTEASVYRITFGSNDKSMSDWFMRIRAGLYGNDVKNSEKNFTNVTNTSTEKSSSTVTANAPEKQNVQMNQAIQKGVKEASARIKYLQGLNTTNAKEQVASATVADGLRAVAGLDQKMGDVKGLALENKRLDALQKRLDGVSAEGNVQDQLRALNDIRASLKMLPTQIS